LRKGRFDVDPDHRSVNLPRHTIRSAQCELFRVEVACEAHVDRNRSLIMGSEAFAYMLEACPGAFINIDIGEIGGPFHSPRYDFNDEALAIGASLFARLVEKKLARSSGA
jgi:metal-dependent amidase/aminoacylase/carboxypeptidase family protein